MCGFAGCLTDRSLTEKATYDQTVHTMTKMLVHRGPDDSGYFSDDHITMGFRRLSIIDLMVVISHFLDDERYWLTLMVKFIILSIT